MLAGIEQILVDAPFDAVLIYGDTNSTLAGALAASKLHVPVAHVEAGLRSFNRRMPEEINRVVADHLSEVLFCPTDAAVENLNREGITDGVHQVGDVMLDTMRMQLERGLPTERVLGAFDVEPGHYVLATIHRAENTDDPEKLAAILAGLEAAENQSSARCIRARAARSNASGSNRATDTFGSSSRCRSERCSLPKLVRVSS